MGKCIQPGPSEIRRFDPFAWKNVGVRYEIYGDLDSYFPFNPINKFTNVA